MVITRETLEDLGRQVRRQYGIQKGAGVEFPDFPALIDGVLEENQLPVNDENRALVNEECRRQRAVKMERIKLERAIRAPRHRWTPRRNGGRR
jgi:hypothetical protein